MIDIYLYYNELSICRFLKVDSMIINIFLTKYFFEEFSMFIMSLFDEETLNSALSVASYIALPHIRIHIARYYLCAMGIIF